eukprot:384318_1
MTNNQETSYFTVSHIPNKGRGLVASIQIPARTVIIAEKPLIETPFDRRDILVDKFNNLNSNNQELFMKLHHETKSTDTLGLLVDKYLKNAICTGDHAAIFLTISFINHSCDPNAYWYMDGEQMKVMTLKNVDPSTEITCSYIDQFQYYWSVKERQTRLKKGWNFDCNCNSCKQMVDKKKRKTHNVVMNVLTGLMSDVNTLLVRQLFDNNHNRWKDILNITRKQIMYVEKYFNSDIIALWNIYYRFLIATMQIGNEQDKQVAIHKYNQLFENINLIWSEDRTMFFVIFLLGEHIDHSFPYVREWKLEKMKQMFHY